MHRSTVRMFLAGLLALAPIAASGWAQTYKPIAQYKLSGSTAKEIAVDSESRQVFVAGDDGVQVLNADTGASVGLVSLKKADDVLLVPGMRGDEPTAPTRGFASADGKVISFSLDGLKPESEARLAAGGASSLCYDMFTNTVEAVSAGGSVTTLDADSGKVLRSQRVPTGAGQVACGTANHVYVADTAANVVHVLNYKTGENDGDYPMMTGHGPSGMTLDTKGRRLFVACNDGVVEVIDTDSGFTFTQLQAGKGESRATFAWTPQGAGQWKAAAFIAQEDGTLTGVRMNAYINYTVGGTWNLGRGLRSVAYDSQTHHLFLTAMHGETPVVVVAGY